MTKHRDSQYVMQDKMVTVPWGFIKLVCTEHIGNKSEFELIQLSSGPVYHCKGGNCGASFPAIVHERLLDNIMKILNDKGPIIGYKWRKQVLRHGYLLTILNYQHETGAVIGVKVLY